MEVFLDSSVLKEPALDKVKKTVLQYNTIEFGFPDGFQEIPFIEKLRLLEILDDDKESETAKLDFSFDITMQLLSGKKVNVYWKENGKRKLAFSFFVTNRYMDLDMVPELEAYPIIITWLTEFIVGNELKKYPLSLENIQALTREKKNEHLK